MNSYTALSDYYDKLMMEDFDYNKIADFLENIFSEYNLDARLVCELACGTGNITIPMAQRGYDMIAIDSSFDMLEVARKKAQNLKINDILFLNQNMTRLDLYGTVDAFYCLIDGINYVLTPATLFAMFKKIKTCFLEKGGLFVFDISSEYKIKNVLGNNTFVYNSDDLFYSWENRFIKSKRILDMYLAFFVKNKNGSYRRFGERHLQRAYKTEELVRILKKAGFEKVDLYDGMSFSSPKKESERIVFVAR